MGADMLIETSYFEGDMDYPIRKRKIINAIESLSYFDDSWDEFKERFDDEFYLDDEDIPDNTKIKGKAIEVVENFFGCLDNRDVTYMSIYGTTIYITGGNSWGDSPTASFDLFSDFRLLPAEIRAEGMIDIEEDVIDYLIRIHNNELPKKLKEELLAFKVARKI